MSTDSVYFRKSIREAQVFCMDLQPAADPYSVVCKHVQFPFSSQSQKYHAYLMH